MIGSVLGGKYRIEAELNRGGMGAVFRARHEVLERPVAVKVLRPELTENEELVTRFMNEAKAASAIRHPSIIEVFDFGYTDDGEAYLVMEFLQGESLSGRIARAGKLAEAEAIHLVRSISGALDAAHAKGIIHRDLKPDNVFVVADPDVGERAKVLDFGIAKLAESQANTKTGALMGTPLYMAPEQARSAAAIDHRADLYSLGCIFYELLTGRPPLVGEGTGEIIAMHMFTQPDPPSTIVSGISPAIESLVMQLLEKDPAARPQSAADVSTALASASGLRPPGASMPRLSSAKVVAAPAAPSLTPTPRRSRLPLVAAGITLAVAGIVALVLSMGGDHEDRPTAAPPVPARIEQARPAPPPPPANPEPIATPAPAPPAPVPSPPAPPRPGKKKPVRSTDKASPIEPTI